MSELIKLVVSYGKGVPVATTTGNFYKDLNTDILYFKNEAKLWEEKPIKPSVWNPIIKTIVK